MEMPDDVVSEDELLGQGDCERTVVGGARGRPVLMTLDVISLRQVGHHDD